jgi:hypothetical protein
MASLEARQQDPNGMDLIRPVFRTGLIPISIFAVMSLVSVSILLVFITHRLVRWRYFYREYVGYNQYIILIYNLLLADLQQAISFAMSLHWLRINKIASFTPPCFLQGWLLNLGDVSSGFFVLAIAVHTWLGVVKGYKMPYRWFITSILLTWLLALVLTLLGPAIHDGRYFTRVGGWVSAANLDASHQLTRDSAGSQLTTKGSASGCTTCGSSLSNSPPWPSTATSSSTCAGASKAL